MANPIRPKDLPPAPSVDNTAALIVDTGDGVFKAVPSEVVEAGGGLTEPTLAAVGGSALVGFQQTGTGAVLRTVQSRLREQWVSVADFGAVADCTAVGVGTNNFTAFRNAIDSLGPSGGTVFVPRGRYRISQRLDFTTCIHLIGEKIGQNPGVIAGVVYSGVTYLYGSVLVFDTNTEGLYFLPHTSEEDQVVVKNSIDALGNASPYWQYPSSDRSHVENLTLISAGASDLEKHGINSRVRITLQHLIIRGFAGDGLHIAASSDGAHVAGLPYGVANMSQLFNLRIVLNKGDGVYLGGRDANGISVINVDSMQNGGWGFNDEGFLGNIYIGGQTASCTLGSYRASSGVAPHVYYGCYVETAAGTGVLASLTAACTVHGGQLASSQCHPVTSQALVMQAGLMERAPLSWTNTRGTANIKLNLGYNDTTMTVFGFGADAVLDGYKLRYDTTNAQWNLMYGGSTSTVSLQIPFDTTGQRTTAAGGGFGVAFPGGFYFGGKGLGAGRGAHHNYATAAPTTGAWTQDDMIWRNGVATGGNLGWACMSSGSPGTWWKAGSIFLDAQSTWDPASIANAASATTTIAVTGAAFGDFVQASFSNSQAGLILSGFVSAADTVTVSLANLTGGAVDLSSGTLRVRVSRRG